MVRSAIAIAGVCFGIVVDHATHGASARKVEVANATAPYALIIAAFALLRAAPRRAAVDAAVFFLAFVVGYYLTLAREAGPGAIDRHYAAVWLLLAAAACPVLAAAVTWARHRSGPIRAIVFALPAAAGGTEALTGRTWGMAGAVAPIVIALDALLIVVYLFVLPRGTLTRAAAVVWAIPITAALLVITTRLADTGAYYRWMY